MALIDANTGKVMTEREACMHAIEERERYVQKHADPYERYVMARELNAMKDKFVAIQGHYDRQYQQEKMTPEEKKALDEQVKAREERERLIAGGRIRQERNKAAQERYRERERAEENASVHEEASTIRAGAQARNEEQKQSPQAQNP